MQADVVALRELAELDNVVLAAVGEVDRGPDNLESDGSALRTGLGGVCVRAYHDGVPVTV